MKEIILCLFFSCSLIFNTFSQKVEFKEGKVLLDGTGVLSYEIKNAKSDISIYKLNTEDEIIFVKWFENSTFSSKAYLRIMFLKEDLELKTTNFGSYKSLVKWFIQEHLFDSDWNINLEKLELFIKKYDEKIIE